MIVRSLAFALRMRKLPLLAVLVLSFLLSACTANINSPHTIRKMDKALDKRDLGKVIDIVEKPGLYKKKERLLYYLDAGILRHLNGEWQESNELLHRAEDEIERLHTKSILHGAASAVLGDSSLEYSGEDYEDIYINVFKALNFLAMGEIDNAFVEIRRVNDKLYFLEEKYARMAKEMNEESDARISFKAGSGRFHSSALASYLSMILYENSGEFDDARIDWDNLGFAFRSQPELYPFAMPDIIHPHSEEAKGLTRVICFVNRGPYKDAYEMHIHSSPNNLMLASSGREVAIQNIRWEGIAEGYYFKFALPYLEDRPKSVARIVAKTQDGRRFELQKLEDLGRVARRSFEIKEPLIILKSVSRTVIKALAAEKIKKELANQQNDLVSSLIYLLADAAVFLSENADLRISHFFPAEAYIAEIPLLGDNETITLQYYSQNGRMIYSENIETRDDSSLPRLIYSWYY